MRRDQCEILADAASAFGQDMIGKCGDAPAETPVSIPVRDFRKIADLLQQTASALRTAQTGLDDDGFRFWIPLPHLDAQREELRKLRGQVNHLTLRPDSFHF